MNLNLECLTFNDIEKDARITAKTTMWDETAQWTALRIPEVADFFQSQSPETIVSGEAGLYLKPYVVYYRTRLYIFWLDVEHPKKHHISTQANIDMARALFYSFSQLGMADDLIIGLTGNGFRFIWPWVIPYAYSKAFLEMVNDSRRFPGIDASPQTGDSKFLRTMAYRGHNNQGTPTSKVHIHYLDRADDILSMDPVKYKRKIHGKPNVDRYRYDILRLLPQKMAPAQAIDLLEEYVFKLKIKSTIAMPQRPRLNFAKGTNWDRIYEYLGQEGITYRTHEYEATDIIKLDSCPACGEKEGSPFITPSGRLKCFRANKCPAGQEGKGLSPHEWVPEYSYQSIPETDIETPGMGLQDARNLLPQALQTEEDIIIHASPGVGKTYAALKHFAPVAYNQLILYTVPTIELYKELYKDTKEDNPQLNIMYIEGRNEENCDCLSEAKRASALGYFPSRTTCLVCDHKLTCQYNKQFEDIPKTGIVLTTHKMANYLGNRVSPDIWVIDENPLLDFFNEMEISQDEMDLFMQTEPENIHPLFQEIKKTCQAIGRKLKGYEQGKLFVSDVPPGNWEGATVLEDVNQTITQYLDLNLYPCNSSRIYSKVENPVVWENNNYKKDRNMKCIKWWDYLIERDPEISLFVEVSRPKGPLVIKYKATSLETPVFPECRIVHLDGTVYPPEIPELFQNEMKIIDAQAHLNTCKKTHIRISRGKHKVRKLSPQIVKRDLELLTSHLREQDQKVLIVTFKNLEKYIMETLNAMHPRLSFGIIHFWGPRGINTYKDFDACLVYGTPTVSPAGVEDLASTLFSDHEEMAKWKDSLGRRDLTQAVHRIRPVNGDKNIVVMGSYWPTEYLGNPTQTIDLMRKGDNVETAKQRLTAFAREYGFIDKPAANMLLIGAKTDKTAIEAWQTRLSAPQGGHHDRLPTLINIYFKSGEAVDGTPPAAIYLGKNGWWNQLLNYVQAETGLPVLGTYKAPGRGGRSKVLGTVDKMVEFYRLIGSDLDLGLYQIAGGRR